MCECREGYAGAQCENLAVRYIGTIILEGLQFSPVLLVTFIALSAFFLVAGTLLVVMEDADAQCLLGCAPPQHSYSLNQHRRAASTA